MIFWSRGFSLSVLSLGFLLFNVIPQMGMARFVDIDDWDVTINEAMIERDLDQLTEEASPKETREDVPMPIEPALMPKEPSSSGRLWRAGLAIAPLTLPVPLTIAGEFQWDRLLGLALRHSRLFALEYGGISFEASKTAGALTVFPWRNWAFAGLEIGAMRVRGELKDDATGVNVGAAASLTTFAPKVGVRHRRESGFVIGADLGVQFAQLSKILIYTNVPPDLSSRIEYTRAKTEAEDAIKSYVDLVLPYVSLIHIGYWF